MVPENWTLSDFIWQSDFNGDEVGYPEVLVAGIYNYEAKDGSTYVLTIDVENMRILESYKMEDE